MGRTVDLALNDEYEGRFVFDSNGRLQQLMIKKLEAPVTDFQEVTSSYLGKVLKVYELPDLMKEAFMLGNVTHKDNWYSKRSFSIK